MKKEIIVPVYYYINDNKEEIIDEEGIREEFEEKLEELTN